MLRFLDINPDSF